MERAYQEVIEGIAGGTTPQNVVAFRPFEAAQARVESLIAQGKSGGLRSLVLIQKARGLNRSVE